MSSQSKGILVGRNLRALDQAAIKARSRSFYAQRKTQTNPRLASAIEVAQAVQAYAMDYAGPNDPSGHPNAKTIIPIGERPQGFSRPQVSHSVGSELPHPGLPASHSDVTEALRALDAVNPQTVKMDAALTRLADEVRAGKRTLENAQAEAKRMFPGVDADSIDISRLVAGTEAVAQDAGLTVQQIINSL